MHLAVLRFLIFKWAEDIYRIPRNLTEDKAHASDHNLRKKKTIKNAQDKIHLDFRFGSSHVVLKLWVSAIQIKDLLFLHGLLARQSVKRALKSPLPRYRQERKEKCAHDDQLMNAQNIKHTTHLIYFVYFCVCVLVITFWIVLNIGRNVIAKHLMDNIKSPSSYLFFVCDIHKSLVCPHFCPYLIPFKCALISVCMVFVIQIPKFQQRLKRTSFSTKWISKQI